MAENIQPGGVYADNEKLTDILKSKIGKNPVKPSGELYMVAIDSIWG